MSKSLARRSITQHLYSLERGIRAIALSSLAGLGLSLLPHGADAESLAEGSTVRVRSNAIEAGWHTGKIKRDERKCWMVQLDRPTPHGYTSLALMVVDALQLGTTGAWTAINTKQAVASGPAHCLAEGAD